MTRVAVIYTSVSGATAETAQLLADELRAHGCEVTGPVEARHVRAAELVQFDGLLLGCPTWGDGGLHPEFAPLDAAIELELQPARRLAGIFAAAFGGCDRAYRHFGRAVELIEDRMIACGARVVQRGLKIELAHNDSSREVTRGFARDFLRRLRGELPPEPHRPAMGKPDVDALMGITVDERRRRDQAGLMPP